MFTISGQPIRTCEGLSRREWLRVGGLSGVGLPGLGLPSLWQSQAAASERKPRAKACIVLFMFGAPAHQDTWDLKPDAPSSVRGEFQPIATNVPGIHVSEHIPRLAQMADRYLQIRSLTHPDNTHTVAMHYMLSGVRHRRPATNPQNAADDQQERRPRSLGRVQHRGPRRSRPARRHDPRRLRPSSRVPRV